MKKIFIISVLLLVVAVFMVPFYFGRQQSSIHTKLSDRAKEYIQSRKAANDDQWVGINFDQKKTDEQTVPVTGAPNTRYVQEQCFAFTVPFEVYAKKKQSDCNVRITTQSPRGAIVVFQSDKPSASPSDVSDIVMRRSMKDKYTEEKKTVNNKDYIIFKAIKIEYEKTAFTFLKGKMVAITLTSATNENLDDKFDQLLSAMVYY